MCLNINYGILLFIFIHYLLKNSKNYQLKYFNNIIVTENTVENNLISNVIEPSKIFRKYE